MRMLAGLILAASLGAQEQAPSGLVRGVLEGWAGTPASGELQIRSAAGALWLCAYNDKTYIERERLRIAASSLKPGEPVEMITDRSGGPCYARTVHVQMVSPPLPPAASLRARMRVSRTASESIVPRGNLTLTGIVLRLSETSLLLRTRSEGQKTILVRQDTGFTASGRMVDISELAVNTRVSVRAGRNVEGDLEAYQVIWGDILPSR
jgi:hypothetical protein